MSPQAMLHRSTLALLACALLVTLAYLFIDRPVALFVHGHRLAGHKAFKWLTYPPVAFDALAPIVLLLAAIRLARGPTTPAQGVLLAVSVSVMVTATF